MEFVGNLRLLGWLSVLREDQYRVIGKTTGTDARMLYWFTEKEYPVIRKPQGANIGGATRYYS